LPFAIFVVLIFSDSLLKNKNLNVALLSVLAAFVQLYAYGLGFLHAFYKRIVLQKDEFNAFTKNFYK